MKSSEKFLYQYFEKCCDQILNGIDQKEREYLFDPKMHFSGRISNNNSNDLDNLFNKWPKIDISSYENADTFRNKLYSDIYEKIRLFLFLCESTEKEEKIFGSRYKGISEIIKELLEIVTGNKPRNLRYGNYVSNIIQSENIIQYILSLFLDKDKEQPEYIFAFGDSGIIANNQVKESVAKYERLFYPAKAGTFQSRQNLIGQLTKSSALSVLTGSIRRHRNKFSHGAIVDVTNDQSKGSDLNTYIINRVESLKRLRYLLIDYITIFYFLSKNHDFRREIKDFIKRKFPQDSITLFLNIESEETYELKLYNEKNVEISPNNNGFYRIDRFELYYIRSLHQSRQRDNLCFLVDQTYTPNVELVVKIPPGEYRRLKPEIKDLIDIEDFPELNKLSQVWKSCSPNENVSEFLQLVKDMTLQTYCLDELNPQNKEKMKLVLVNSFQKVCNAINKGNSVNTAMKDLRDELQKNHIVLKEALNKRDIRHAYELIEEAFSQLSYLKTDGSKKGKGIKSQELLAMEKWLNEGVLDLTNTDNDRYIENVRELTVLNAIFQTGELSFLEIFLNHRIKNIKKTDKEISDVANKFRLLLYKANQEVTKTKELKTKFETYVFDFFSILVPKLNDEKLVEFLAAYSLHVNYMLQQLPKGAIEISELNNIVNESKILIENNTYFIKYYDEINKERETNNLASIENEILSIENLVVSFPDFKVLAELEIDSIKNEIIKSRRKFFFDSKANQKLFALENYKEEAPILKAGLKNLKAFLNLFTTWINEFRITRREILIDVIDTLIQLIGGTCERMRVSLNMISINTQIGEINFPDSSIKSSQDKFNKWKEGLLYSFKKLKESLSRLKIIENKEYDSVFLNQIIDFLEKKFLSLNKKNEEMGEEFIKMGISNFNKINSYRIFLEKQKLGSREYAWVCMLSELLNHSEISAFSKSEIAIFMQKYKKFFINDEKYRNLGELQGGYLIKLLTLYPTPIDLSVISLIYHLSPPAYVSPDLFYTLLTSCLSLPSSIVPLKEEIEGISLIKELAQKYSESSIYPELKNNIKVLDDFLNNIQDNERKPS